MYETDYEKDFKQHFGKQLNLAYLKEVSCLEQYVFTEIPNINLDIV